MITQWHFFTIKDIDSQSYLRLTRINSIITYSKDEIAVKLPFVTLSGQLLKSPEEVRIGLNNLICTIRNSFDKGGIKSYINMITTRRKG